MRKKSDTNACDDEARSGTSRLQQELAAIRRKLNAETPEQRVERLRRQARDEWERAHRWDNRPLRERKELLARAERVDVAYVGAGYGSWHSPTGEWRARARVVHRETRGFEVELMEPLRFGTTVSGLLPHTPGPILHDTGYRMRFTNGGKHRDRPVTTFICVPSGWTPAPWPDSND